MTASQVRRPAEWTGRVLLLAAVAFWWGAIVVPRLVSLAFPELLPPDAIPRDLNPDKERTVANAVSAIFLLIAALLAFANALRSFGTLRTQDVSRRGVVRQARGWVAAGGWTALAVTAAYLAWEEVSEFHVSGTRDLREIVLGSSNSPWLWPVVLRSADSSVRADDGDLRPKGAPFDKLRDGRSGRRWSPALPPGCWWSCMK